MNEQYSFDSLGKVIKENQVVPKNYKKPKQKRRCIVCDKGYIRDDYKIKEKCPHCSIARKITENVGYIGTKFALLFLPSRTPKERIWTRTNGKFTLVVEGGSMPKYRRNKVIKDKNGNAIYEELKIPAGIIPRHILQFLSYMWVVRAEMPIEERRVINIGTSLYDFMKKIGLSTGGKSYKTLVEQSDRLFRARIGILEEGKDYVEETIPKRLVDKVRLFWDHKNAEQQSILSSTVTLSDSMIEVLSNSMPLNLNTLSKFGCNIMAYDLYCFLNLKHYCTTTPFNLTNETLHKFFSPRMELKQFNFHFKKAFTLVKKHYPHNTTLDNNIINIRPSRTDIDPSILSQNKKIFLQNFIKSSRK